LQLPHALATCALLRRPPRPPIDAVASSASASGRICSAAGRGSGCNGARVVGGLGDVVDSEAVVVPVAGLFGVLWAADDNSSSIIIGGLAPATESMVTS